MDTEVSETEIDSHSLVSSQMAQPLYETIFLSSGNATEVNENARRLVYVIALSMILGSFFTPVTLLLIFVSAFALSNSDVRSFLTGHAQQVVQMTRYERTLAYVKGRLGL